MKKKNKFKQIIKKYHNWKPPKYLCLVLLLLPIVVYSFIPFKVDNDFWFLINTGKYITNNTFPHIEPFTIHNNFNFIAQQWLTDIIFYKIYINFNMLGMYIFIIIINLIITYILYKTCLLLSNNKIKLSLFTTIFTIAIIKNIFITTRPFIFDITLILLEIYLLELYIKNNNKYYLLGLPIISLLMINLHASMWPMIFVILLPYYLGRINTKYTTKEKYNLKPIILTTLIMLLLGLINPYGIDSITYLFNSYGIKNINNFILEMMPLTLGKNILSITIYTFIFIILVSYYIKKPKEINIRYLLLFLGTLCLTLLHIRGLMFLALVGTLSITYNLKDYCYEKEIKTKNNINEYILPIILLIFFVVITITNTSFKYEKDMSLSNIANYLDNNTNKNIKIYTSYASGGYLEYRGYKCYIDPRAEVFIKKINKKEDIFEEYYNLQHGTLNIKDFLNKYNFDYLLLEEDLIEVYIYELPNYQKVYEEKEYKLYKNIGKENE